MPSDYQAITRSNVEKLGTDTASRSSQVAMYSDPTHFVYELLQNADDHKASEVTFTLLRDRLVFEHNGSELFTTRNVEAISYFGKSTSREDLVKAGRFGLGFKSVFAFTATPIVHSGEEHFEIYGLYRLRGASPPRDLPLKRTRILLPFNHNDLRPDYVERYITPQEAFHKIADRLSELDMTSLLFTLNIREIHWENSGVHKHLLRKDRGLLESSDGLQARETTITDGFNPKRYLVFTRPIEWRDGIGKEPKHYRPIDIAFRIDDDGFIRNERKPLIVLFPTKIETHLGLLINGLYRTPAHRESIKEDDPFNEHLIRETAALLHNSLFALKERGVLTLNLLETLPIVGADFPPGNLLRPLFETVRLTLSEQPLLPTESGNFVAGKHAKLARGSELRTLLNKEQLQTLFASDSPLEWLTGELTKDRAYALHSYLIGELGVEEVTPELFVAKITKEFLRRQSDEWLMKFYAFLNGHADLWDRPGSVLRKKEFIRLEDDSLVCPFSEDGKPNAYLPGSGKTDFATVKKQLAEDREARSFLSRLGIIEPDVFSEVIEFILPKYSRPQITVKHEENIQDLHTILYALKSSSSVISTALRGKLRIILAQLGFEDLLQYFETLKDRIPFEGFFRLLLRRVPLFRAETLDSATAEYRNAESLYLLSSELELYFWGNKAELFLIEGYPAEIKGLCIELGAQKTPLVKCRPKDQRGYIVLSKNFGHHERGIDGYDPDWEVAGLQSALQFITVEKARYIWNEVAVPNSKCIRGTVESSSRQTYENSGKEDSVSKMGKWLCEMPWLPSPDGGFVRPDEISLEDLPEDFARDEALAKKLFMKDNIEQLYLARLSDVEKERMALTKLIPMDRLRRLAKEVAMEADGELADNTSYSVDDVDYEEEIKRVFRRPGADDIFQGDARSTDLTDPERYRDRTQEVVQDARKYEPPAESRFRRVARRVWEGKASETRKFLEEEYAGRCQICGASFPKRSGKPYFECVYIVHRTRARWLDHQGNLLCLCPTCCAKFQHGAVEAEDILEQSKALKTKKEGGSSKQQIHISLCGVRESITFNERHLVSLQELLKSGK
jgi:hypothetical protein